MVYSQRGSMRSPLLSAAIPPCHHSSLLSPHSAFYWVISISPSTLIFQSNHPPLKSTQNNFSPPNSFQRHPLPLGALQRENPFIFDSRLSRNGSNVSCNRDECNQAGFWWANGWTRTPLVCQEWYCIWQLCHFFFPTKPFFDLQRKKKKLLRFHWHLDQFFFVSLLLCQTKEKSSGLF